MSFLPLVRIWLWLSVLATVAGWALSAIGQLNRVGYSILACGGVLLLWLSRKSLAKEWISKACPGRKLQRPFRRALPLAFALLTLLVFLGGVLYAPTNHTALTYRIPRILQWLAHERWFWIHTANYRMNDRACGIEWLSAPILLFTRSDRSLFLLNFLPFLLLPGLVFSLFTRLGMRPKVAWYWMWLLPTGYTFLLQAASTGNDTFPTVYALAALDFACRAWTTRKPMDLLYSLFAAALLTGAKASNLPLLLPWAIAFGPLLLRIEIPRVRAMLVLAVALLVSFLPTAILNLYYCGDWSGLALERSGMDMKNPLVGILGNGALFLLDNLVPPFLPGASWWNQNALALLPQSIVGPMVANFEWSFHWLWELPTEDWVGIGFGVSWLALAAFLAAFVIRGNPQTYSARQDAPPRSVRRCLLVAPWLALLAYCVKSGMATGARLISPYYPLLLPLLLVSPKQNLVIRQRWWRVLVLLVIALAIPVVILTPARPLWPAQTVLARLSHQYPRHHLLARAYTVYSVYATRADPLAGVRSFLPPDLTVVGFMGRGDDPDISLWRPFGRRRVEHVLVSDSRAQIRKRGIEYLVAGDISFGLNGTSFEAWAREVGAKPLGITNITVRVSEGPQAWHIVRFPQDGS